MSLVTLAFYVRDKIINLFLSNGRFVSFLFRTKLIIFNIFSLKDSKNIIKTPGKSASFFQLENCNSTTYSENGGGWASFGLFNEHKSCTSIAILINTVCQISME